MKIKKGQREGESMKSLSLKKIICFAIILLISVGFDRMYASGNNDFISNNDIQQLNKSGLIQGRILDKDGEPLIGVTIKNISRDLGVVSDLAGYFSIEASKGDKVVFSYIGFLSYETTISNQTSLEIVLNEDIKELDEVVVVGMGQQRKASVIGSISSVNVNEINTPSRSLTASMSGRLAGATIVQRSGEPGSDAASFWIRGISTFGSSKSPLILVDGVERSMDDVVTEEIESFSILKDASATAVYGVRAANGVVLISTRKGTAQIKPSISVKLESGISQFTRLPEYLDAANYARLYNEAQGFITYDDIWIENMENKVNPYIYPNVNWFDEVFNKNSYNTNANISINGGGSVARYFINASYYGEDGNLKDNPDTDYSTNINLKRYNFRSNIDVNLTKTTILNLEIGAILSDTHSPMSNYGEGGAGRTAAQAVFYHANRATPISNAVRLPIGTDSSGNIIWGFGAPPQIGESNPVEALMGRGYRTRFSSSIMSQIVLNQDLNFLLPGLKFIGNFSFDAVNVSNLQRRKTSATYSASIEEGSDEMIIKEINKGSESLSFSKDLSNTRAIEFKSQLLYEKLFKQKHRLGAMLMYYQRDYINASAGSSTLALPYRKQGVAVRSTYAYRDTYFGEFNMGYNGSENFPKANRFGYFPAGALGYMISNEKFWNPKVINVLKLRGSLGLVGAEQLAGGRRFGYLDTYSGGLGDYNFGESSSTAPGVGEDMIGVSNLTWEKGLKSNIGFEMKMLDSRVSIDVDLFHEKRSDILVLRTSLPAITGYMNNPYANIGRMQNKGIEITTEFADNIGGLGYRIYGNYSLTRNKILEKDEAAKLSPWRMETGQRYGQQFGLVAIGLFKDEEDISTSPRQTFGEVRPGDVKYLDINGDGIIDIEDRKPIGYSNIPEIIYGFGAQFDYKGFDIGLFFRGQANVTYSLGGSTFVPFIEGVGKHNLYTKALDRWSVENPNPNAFYPRLDNGRNSNNWQLSTRTIYDGSLLRLSDIELGYTLKKNITLPLHINSARIYAIATNMGLWSKWDMWDPETGSSNGSEYPLTRKINIGIKLTF
ncbi:MAG: TonB-dependent receptor [Proteiniphilum sp.]|nr:TonB-dependent receptor [Proteiniphilum sp.]